jgi:hypothetical protein
MSKHSDAFEALLTLGKYCKNRSCDNCCFYIEDYCPFGTHFVCPEFIVGYIHEELSERVHHLEQLEIEEEEKHE